MKKLLNKLLIITALFFALILSAGCLGDCFGSSKNEDDTHNGSGNSSTVHTCTFGDWTVVTPASCTEKGLRVKRCKCGNTLTEKTDILPHTAGEAVKENVVNSTCSTLGSYDLNVHCTDCNKLLSSEKCEIEYSDHNMTNVKSTGEYCGEKEVSNVYCSVCDTLVASFGHSYKKSVTNATCTESGTILFSCIYCDDSYSLITPPNGHVESDLTTFSAPTCENDGLAIKKCLICKDTTKKVTLKASGHTYVGTESEGGVLYTCKVCSHSHFEETDKSIYSIRYVSEGNTVTIATLTDGEEITYFPEVTKEGSTLLYWAIDAEGKNPYSSQPVYANTYLYAIFEEDKFVNTEKSDIAAFSSVSTDFTFSVMAPNAEYLKNNLSVYSLSGEQLIYTLNATNDGYFEVCSKYLPGNHYYAVATGDVTFRGTESKEIQFSVAGENRTEMTLNSTVKMLESKDIYLILDAEGKKCLLTTKEFAVGDNVAIYEKTEENILLIIKINAKDIVMEHNAYIFEVADYDKVFDKIDVSVSGGLRDCDFEINPAVTEQIKTEFLKSDFYIAAKTSAIMLAEKTDFELDLGNVRVGIAMDDAKIVITLAFSFEYKDKFTIDITCRYTVDARFDYNLDSITSYSALLTTTNTFNFQISFSESHSLDDPKNVFVGEGVDKTYFSLLEQFKENFDENRQLLSVGKKSSAPKDILIGRVTVQISAVTITFDLGIKFDFSVSGSVGFNASATITNTYGIRNGSVIDSYDIKLTGLYVYGVAKLEFAMLGTAEVFISIAGIGVYGNINAGPYVEVGVAGSIGYDGSRIFLPRASVYVDSGIKVDANLGLKGELFGIKIFDIGFNIPIEKTHFSEMPLGSKEIYIDFLKKEKEVEYNAICDKSYVADLNTLISREITYQSVEDMTVGNKVPDNVFFSISSVSGYASKITLKGNKLYFDNVPETVILEIKVKFNDSISKVVKFTYSVEHTDDCTHLVCTEDTHFGGSATCTERAICQRCGLEYGPEPAGHKSKNGVCIDCGEVLESEGLLYSQLEDGTYEVVGIGSCKTTYIAIPEKHDGIPVTSIGKEAFKDCTQITGVTIPKSINHIGHDAFLGCSYLSEIKLYAEKVALNKDYPYDTNSMFGNVGSKTDGITVTIGKTVTEIPESFFSDVEKITRVEFEKGGVCKVIGRSAFLCCRGLIEVYLPDTVEKISEMAFYGCYNLVNIGIPSSVKVIGENAIAPYSTIKYNEYGNAYYIGNENNPYLILAKAKNTSIASCVISDTTIFILPEAFKECQLLESVVIPDSVAELGEYAFYGCKKLSSAHIGASVKSVSPFAFGNCSGLLTLTFSENSKIEVIADNAFNKCTSLKNVTLPDSLISIGFLTFDCSKNLEFNEYDNALYIGSKDNPYMVLVRAKNTSITSCNVHGDTKIILYQAFFDCKSLRNVSLPDSLIYIGWSAFLDCNYLVYNEYEGGYYLGNENNPYIAFMKPKSTSVTEITLHNDTKFIYSNSFAELTKLKRVNVGDSLIGIGNFAFNKCTAFESINIPDSIVYIESYAFRDCDSLKTIVFPKNLKILGEDVFCYCNSIVAIYFEADTVPPHWGGAMYNALKYVFGYDPTP